MTGYQDPSLVTPNGLTYFGVSFFVTPLDNTHTEIQGLVIPTPIIMWITSNTLKTSALLFFFNTVDGKWEDSSATCTGANFFLSNTGGTLNLNVCHFTQYAVYQALASSTSGSASTGASTGHISSTASSLVAPAISFILASLAYLIL